MSNPRAAVIGYGYAGRAFHSYLINLAPNLDLHGIASSRPEKRVEIAQRRGCRAYESVESVLADPDVDLVVLATSNDVHAELAIRALEAGKHVVTDKPMAVTLDECDRMIATAKQTGKLLSVFQNRRWDGDFLTVQKLIAEGKLGDVRWIEMAWQRWGAPRGWRGVAAGGGGRFYDLGAHLLDQMLLLFPQPIESVYCRMHHDFETHDVESHVMLVITFEGGTTGVCDMGSMAAIEKPRFHVYGTAGTFIKYGLDPQEVAMNAEDIDSAGDDPASYGRLSDGANETVIPTVPGRWRSYYENIGDALTGRAESAVKLTEARRVMSVLDAGLRSAQTGEVVQVRKDRETNKRIR